MHIPLEDQASRVRVKYGRERRYCKECGGKGICERGGCAEGYRGCEDCGGKGICEQGRQRSQCKECGGGSGHVTTVGATAVEVFEDEEEPHEWLPTVQGHLVVAAGLRGGKRKRTGAMTSDGDFRRPTWLPAQSGNTGRSDPLSLACVVLCVHTLCASLVSDRRRGQS